MKRTKKTNAERAVLLFRLRCAAACFCFFLLLFFFLANAEAAADGVSAALRLCGTQLIPALLPCMVLCGFFVNSSLGAFAAARLEKPMRLLFALPGAAAPALLFGVLGGYPVGAAALLMLVQNGKLAQKEAARLQTLCFCPSPAFVIGAVGAGLFGSVRFGALLFCSVLLSMAFLLQGLRLFPRETLLFGPKAQPECLVSEGQAFVGAVEAAARQTAVLCGFVCFFGALRGLLGALRMPESLMLALRCVLEITDGCLAARGVLPLAAFAALLSFGGVCSQCQILPALLRFKVKLPVFFAVRLLHALLSFAVCALLLRLFPVQTAVLLQQQRAVQPAAPTSVAVSLCLLAMCVLLLLGNQTAFARSRLHLRAGCGIIPQGGEMDATKTAE